MAKLNFNFIPGDRVGVIPGSAGAKSLIVCGKGNPESFHFSSHGAGPAMSAAPMDVLDVVCTLRQVVCVNG